MGLSLSSARQQSNELENANETIRTMRVKLRDFQHLLSNEWKAEELTIINQFIETLVSDMNKASIDLYSLSSDIMTTAEEIIREEEAMKKKKSSGGSPISKR